MKKILIATLTLTVATHAQSAQLLLNSGPSNPNGLSEIASRADQNFNELYSRIGDVPVAIGGWFPGESNAAGASGAVEQGSFRKLYFLPRGANYIRLLMSNTAASTSVGETDMPTAFPISLSVETNVPAPWSASAIYATGAVVTYGALQYTALAGNTGVQPDLSATATWSSAIPGAPKPITCNGNRACGLPLLSPASGAAVAQGYFVTDPVTINMAAPGLIAVDMFSNQPAATGLVNTINTGPITSPFNGEYANFGSAQGDNTLTGGYSFGPVNPIPAPIVIGQPAVAGAGVCYFSDSIDAGVQGLGLLYQSGTLTGGTGFVTADVGRIGTASSTNNAATAVNANAQVRITGVSGGALTYALTSNGSYSSAVSTGPYTLNFPGAAGTGASVSSFGTGSAHDNAGAFGAEGALQRALADNGVPFVAFARSGDLLSNYQTRDYTRLSMVARSGCQTAFVELGINDIFGGASGATTVARSQALVAQLRGLGVKSVIGMTLTPGGTSSSDGYLTQGGQTVNNTFNIPRATFNAAVRASTAPWFNGFIDPAACVEQSMDAGIWKTDGVTYGRSTIDGTHPSATGTADKEACLVPQIKALMTANVLK